MVAESKTTLRIGEASRVVGRSLEEPIREVFMSLILRASWLHDRNAASDTENAAWPS